MGSSIKSEQGSLAPSIPVGKSPIRACYPPEETEPWDVKTRKRRKQKPVIPGGLRDLPAEALLLGVTKEKVLGFIESGELKYINVGNGKKRPRYRFSDADTQEFIEKRKVQETPCQFSNPKSPRRIIGTVSKSAVIGFTALRAAQIAKKPKR